MTLAKNSNAVFLYSVKHHKGILLKAEYSLKPLKPKRNEDRKNVYFLPNHGQPIPLMEFMNAQTRLKKFFSASDGPLLGALADLSTMGKIESEEL